ncbi:MAG: phosphonopyruvate decarboxylase [Rhodospirillales bacterium]|nr:phosphonopyruvate decarboxylase [Rhodospirillales bacterium]
MTETNWSKQLLETFVDAGVTLFPYVPDAGNKRLIEHVNEKNGITSVLLTTEEEGIAVAAGADLVGGKAVVCMQSSGVGNIPNFLSFVKGGRFPVLMMVTMRGDYGEENPWQYPMGQAVEPILTAMGVQVMKVDSLEELMPAARAALSAVFVAGTSVALVLTQRFLGAKKF